MISTIDLARRLRRPVGNGGRSSMASADMDHWGDTLARLVRSHQARRSAADPSRPWLSVDAQSLGQCGQAPVTDSRTRSPD